MLSSFNRTIILRLPLGPWPRISFLIIQAMSGIGSFSQNRPLMQSGNGWLWAKWKWPNNPGFDGKSKFVLHKLMKRLYC